MRLEYQQNLRMEQKLLQSPQMIQAMEILQLSTPELLDRIEAELQENPFLEVADQSGDGEKSDSGPDAESADTRDDDAPDMAAIGELERLIEAPPRTRAATSAAESQFDAMQSLAANDAHTTDSILGELRMRSPSEDTLEAADVILAGLDVRGFLPEGLEPLAEESSLPLRVLEETLEVLRELAHPALGAQTLQEAFQLQLEAQAEPLPVAQLLVRDHFAELLQNRLPQIARAMGVELDEVRKAIETLSTLDVRPLGDLEPDTTMTLIPDVLVSLDESGNYQVSLVRDGLPELRLSKGAREALERVKNDQRTHDFLLKRIERARWFLDAVGQRRQSLLKIATDLFERQREFLDYGPEKLKPLKMQAVAEAVGVHLSTVSRAIRGKYAQTPQGVVSLKSLFTGGQKTASGGERSRVSIQERIREVIEAEDKKAPLSDEEVARILKQRDGIKVARRTVTKYRIAMGIPASTLRRNY